MSASGQGKGALNCFHFWCRWFLRGVFIDSGTKVAAPRCREGGVAEGESPTEQRHDYDECRHDLTLISIANGMDHAVCWMHIQPGTFLFVFPIRVLAFSEFGLRQNNRFQVWLDELARLRCLFLLNHPTVIAFFRNTHGKKISSTIRYAPPLKHMPLFQRGPQEHQPQDFHPQRF